MEIVSLNLARKLRSQNFDQIIGQNLAVRILKNSLYLGHYFPVYLFAGQRGCGKTTTARVFAAALNCNSLQQFQKKPKKVSLPCLICTSCIAMREGNHPDFIEIDAASHTGVDNIRNIIDSSSLLPLMGRKRIYLIDEAHMLSKAAFNALLKILEEPPASVLFILATTNQQKIIDTVRSRCFQLFFTPVAHDPLQDYLKSVCASEEISYDDKALDLIIKQTEGSVRDALNLLETVRFSSSIINTSAVQRVLGHVNDEYLITVVHSALSKSPKEVLKLLQTVSVNNYSAEYIWQRLIVLLRGLIWLKHGVNPQHIVSSVSSLHDLAKRSSLSDLHRMIEVLYAHESIFLKTTNQHSLLEMVLLSMCAKNKKSNEGGGSTSAVSFALSDEDEVVGQEDEEEDVDEEDNEQDEDEQEHDETYDDYNGQWLHFVKKVEMLHDPLVTSLFKQAHYKKFDPTTNELTVEFSKDFVFFKEWLQDTQEIWLPLLCDIFSVLVTLNSQFTGVKQNIQNEVQPIIQKDIKQNSQKLVQSKTIKKEKGSNASVIKSAIVQNRYGNNSRKRNGNNFFLKEERIDVSDIKVWQKANTLLRYFPGVVTQVRESQ